MTRDLRRYARQTNIRLLIGGVVILFLVGDGLVYIIYGQSAAILGFICILFGLSPILFVGLILFTIEWLVNRYNNQ